MANGIKIGSQEVWADYSSNGLWFTFEAGGPQSLPNYRGEDDVVPQAAGREPGLWIADTRELVLHGIVAGTGASAQATRESFASRFALVAAVMVPTSTVTITVYPPHFGLAAGKTAVLTGVRPMRIVGPDPSKVWYEGWEGSLELVTTSSLSWVIS